MWIPVEDLKGSHSVVLDNGNQSRRKSNKEFQASDFRVKPRLHNDMNERDIEKMFQRNVAKILEDSTAVGLNGGDTH